MSGEIETSADHISQGACGECDGRTILFRGSGKDMQYYICSRGQEPGHLTWKEVQAELRRVRNSMVPSGRIG